MVEDLSQNLPDTRGAWVDLLLLKVWYVAVKPKAMDISRRKINRSLHNAVEWWSVIGQLRICFGLPHLFSGDGVHLSPEV